MSTDTTDVEPSGHHDSGSFGREEPHAGLTDMQYIVVAAILALITALEVSLTYMDIGALFLPILLILMAIKFFTVVLYFMHLKFDAPIYRHLFYIGLGLALFVYVVALFTFHFFAS